MYLQNTLLAYERLIVIRIHKGDQISSLLSKLQSTRDLRAEILALAHALSGNGKRARLEVRDPRIGVVAIDQEWQQSLGVLSPDIAQRMSLKHLPRTADDSMTSGREPETPAVSLDRPNYRFEVLRWLITAAAQQETQSVKSLEGLTGASRTPIEAALDSLVSARLVSRLGRGRYSVRPEDISIDVLAKLQALPQTVRFRYGLGAIPKPPGSLLSRVDHLLHLGRPGPWSEDVYLSGVAGAYAGRHDMDLMGVPRVDLVMHVRSKEGFATSLMRDLDDGLEPDRSPLDPAPVVITLVHGARITESASPARVASPGDIFLSMIDLGLKGPAMEYIKGHMS